MKLIYINFVGKNYQGLNVYEFLFSEDNLDIIDGEDWDSCPAAGSPKPPKDHVNEAYILENEITLELIQNHNSFNMADTKHGVISLAWEDEQSYENSTSAQRLFFSFGEDRQKVEDKLYARDMSMKNIFINE